MAKIQCPHCEYQFVRQKETGKERCPGCGDKFTPKQRTLRFSETLKEEDQPERDAPDESGVPWKLIGLAVALVLLAIFAKDLEKLWHKEAEPEVAVVPAPVPSPAPVEPAPVEPAPVDTARQRQARINNAVNRGAAYLKAELGRLLEKERNKEELPEQFGGEVALAALSLLHSGVAADDPVIVAAHNYIRNWAIRFTKTYTIACTILFLDHVGSAQDKDMILRLGSRLMAGQSTRGTWHYDSVVSGFSIAEQVQVEQLLFNYLQTVNARQRTGDRRLLAAALSRVPVVRWLLGAPPDGHQWGDNSNTQFAVLALWVARRHGLPALPSLAMVNLHFRSTHKEGVWSYARDNRWRASMTCAGLLCLGICNSLDPLGDPASNDLTRDPIIENGFQFLGKVIHLAPDPDIEKGTMPGTDSRGDLYFLWSLERVGMLYDVDTIAGKNWYAWASTFIVATQHEDGSWKDKFPGIPDTCFALLVLKKVNLAPDVKISPDLTRSIKSVLTP